METDDRVGAGRGRWRCFSSQRWQDISISVAATFRQFALSKIVAQADARYRWPDRNWRTRFRPVDAHRASLQYHFAWHRRPKDSLRFFTPTNSPCASKILSALRRQVALRELLLDHPLSHLQVEPRGQRTICRCRASPVGAAATPTSSIWPYDHVQISKGEINYNDQKTPLEADLV